jgi:alpha-N-arabinofuranosidase
MNMQNKKTMGLLLVMLPMAATFVPATEFNVAVTGNDTNVGTLSSPFRTIQHAADLAQPGDTITVHAGVYRERVNPPRGGESDAKRIVYQAAPGKKVEIRGSEVVRNWEQVKGDVWKATLPNSFFGHFNPYSDLIYGDWFGAKNRQHHTGAVYLNGEWLVEAASIGELLDPGAKPKGKEEILVNVAWLQLPGGGKRIQAVDYAAQEGVQKAPCDEGGQCLGYIGAGDWVSYEKIDFGAGTSRIELRIASAASQGGYIEIRRGGPDGELLGTCVAPGTGGWQSWQSVSAAIKPLSGVHSICLRVTNIPRTGARDDLKWFALVNTDRTTIWAQFKGVNPNEQLVEINVRRAVFYPDQPGRNYITVRGFGLRHAATPWAPPTSEQVGLIGTHWSRGWIIEENDISHSVCTAVTLGKYGDEWDNQSANSAEGYVKTIERGFANGWNKATVGHHVVRNNTIAHCEQAGIIGSLGAVFSTVTANTIHDIHVRKLFGGAEMAGIKFHGAIDTEISHNHIYNTCLAIWLDWMAQGTHVTRNLMHDNGEDLFTEVDHGPILVDNNIFLSARNLASNSQGAGYAHNLFAGAVVENLLDRRKTPYMKPHSTEVVALPENPTGDHRFYNNVFVGRGDMSTFDRAELPMQVDGNVFFKGTKPCKHELNPQVNAGSNPEVHLVDKDGSLFLDMTLPEGWAGPRARSMVTTDLLGKTAISQLPFEQPDGMPLRLDTDYFGKPRNGANPTPGPFEVPGNGKLNFKVY